MGQGATTIGNYFNLIILLEKHKLNQNCFSKGAIKFTNALETIDRIEVKLTNLKDERKLIAKAKKDLAIEDGSKKNNIYDEQLKVTELELVDLRNVWQEMKLINEKLNELNETKWPSLKPKLVRNTLEELLDKLKHLPVRMRRYEVYEYNMKLLNEYVKKNQLLNDLKSEALKDRHWEQIMKHLSVNWSLNELSLSEIWQSDLVKIEFVLKDIIAQAQGEKGLEEYLKQVLTCVYE